MNPASGGPSLTRRALAAVAAAGTVTALAPATPASAATAATGLPVLAVGADWASVLAATPQVQLVPGATYTLSATVELPDGCRIVGNGATVTVTGDTIGALKATGRSNITLTGITFLGRTADPLGSAASFGHVGLRLDRCTNTRVLDCDFTHWRGAGIAVTGSASDDYFAYRSKLRGNTFDRCYFGVSIADRCEYSVLSDNTFTYCRLAIWNSSGNWTINDNSVMGCYGAYYSFARTSPYGSLTSDNWNHGALSGNTFNHSNGGAKALWSANAAFPVGGSALDPGSGIVVNGLLPPTFTGNTLWYTDIRATDLAGTGWLLSGCTLSNLTVTCTGTAPVRVVGTQCNGAADAPVFSGRVTDVLAALG
ncbi:right-handed parallel beta-helix repeat-containing protein [Streptomyces sp. NBC_01766]|uniref:right-handed parallel beta-helix repeat-containing protein n=1 Tax=Streptomyces sp. NBC_01766 TaxID=2975936 RepID=UPI002DD93AF6|nr:right-handed parallel beta-helix repeat-containing protein [Streptomyces sp. NBC_01766]WSC24110.1 right-handed parallel beta-helix repeat-containing protein [Streptomyces sp. NBC_01766]